MLIIKLKVKISAKKAGHIAVYANPSRVGEIHHFNDGELEKTQSPLFIHDRLGNMYFSISTNFNSDVFSQYNLISSLSYQGDFDVEHEFYLSFPEVFPSDNIEIRNKEIFINNKKVYLALKAITSSPFKEELHITDLDWLFDASYIKVEMDSSIVSF